MWAAAPGQAAVLYDGEVVLGGGRIVRSGGVADGVSERRGSAASGRSAAAAAPVGARYVSSGSGSVA